MRFLAVAAVAAVALSNGADAQFWAKPGTQPAGAAADPSAPADTSGDDATLGPPPQSPARDAEMPRLAPPAPGSSLGGSGDTGTDSIGILPARDTNFARTTWRYSTFANIVGLLERLPDRIDSAAQHELAKNLLVSIADSPKGDDGGSRLLALRVRKLLAMGNVVDAAALARAAPGLHDDPALAKMEVEAELLAGQLESACIDLRSFAGILTDTASQNALMLCRQRDGELGDAVGLPPMDTQSLGAAARLVGAPLPADPQSAPPARLVAAALDTQNDPSLRLESAFSAGRASALYGEFLAKLFASASGSPVPADAGAPINGAAAASLYQAIVQDSAIGDKLNLAERGLLSPLGVSDKIGVAMVAPLRSFQPVAELGDVAQRFAILFYTLGDIDAAAPWVELAEESGNAALLWPYRVLIKQAAPTGIAAWKDAAALDGPHMARIMTILSAFGVTTPPGPSARIAGDDRPEAPFGDLLGMDEAAKNLRVGETVLRALIVLGRDGPARAHPLTLRRALADLEQVSMHTEAHALAFEAITATLFDGKGGFDAKSVGAPAGLDGPRP